MKNITIHIDGKEITAQISDEAAAELLQEDGPRTGYERVDKNETYYHTSMSGGAFANKDEKINIDDMTYKFADYHSDRVIAENNARADKLVRQIRQWQALNDEPVNWNCDNGKYAIYYACDKNQLGIINVDNMRDLGQIYFSSAEKTIEALEIFRSELTWYFTEYRQRLDEPERKKEE